MWDLIITAAGIGFGIMGLAAYLKTNFEGRQREKDLKNKIEELEGFIKQGQMIDPRLLIQKEKDLINSARDEILMLGINGLGVFHESFEDIISFIKDRGGKVRVLLLDPESEAFKQREEKEEGNGGEKSGRLRAEYLTSIAFCKDIVRLSNSKDSLELRTYNEEPEVALLVADAKSDTGILHVNEYKSTELIRGYAGEHRFISKMWPDIFQQWTEKYEMLWNKAK